MPVVIAMPKLGMTMKEGTVVEWRLPVGQRVAKGEVILSIESEKAEIEIEASDSGVLRHIYVANGETVPCGTLLGALTATPDENFDPEALLRSSAHAGTEPVRREQMPASVAGVGSAPAPAGGRAAAGGAIPITPAARRRAAALGVDPSRVPGGGPGGRVTREDVEAYAEDLGKRVAGAGGVMLEVPEHGSGLPLFLLPGFGTDVSAFARQVPVLAAHYHVRGVNPRGVGTSDAPESELYDIMTAAHDVAALITDPAHIVGASLGAAVAVEMAIVHPRCVRSLTLVTPFVNAGPRLRAVIDAWHRIAAVADGETLARALLPWLFSPAYLSDEARRERTVRGLVQTVARVAASTLSRSAAGTLAWSGTRTRDLAGITAPTLVVAAGADLLTPDSRAIADAIPGARHVIIPGAGHAVPLEAPDAVNGAILEHLARVSSA